MFLKKSTDTNKTPDLPGWKVVIVNDEPAIHDVTRLALKGLEFEGRKLEFISAYSAEEGKRLLEAEQDVALAFIDVVMESEKAGLTLVNDIRTELGNHETRLILRTGQPGQAPEEEVIKQYDINDYKEKTDLTSGKMKSCVLTALRSYRDIQTILQSKRHMNDVLRSSSSVLKPRSLVQFGSAVLQQVVALLNVQCTELYLLYRRKDIYGNDEEMLLAVAGTDIHLSESLAEFKVPPEAKGLIQKAFQQKRSEQSDSHFVGYYPGSDNNEKVFYLKLIRPLTEPELQFFELFANNVSMIFEKLTEKELVNLTQRELISILGEAIELRSSEADGHIQRSSLMSQYIAREMGLSKEFVDTIYHAACLHDIGKVNVPESILSKPGKLTREEFELVKKHTTDGYNMLKSSSRSVAQMGAIIAKTHHENWDGKGYPDGLKGLNIPIEGRIMCIVDVVDALLSAKPYKKAWLAEDIISYIEDQSGRFFDPQIAELVVNHFAELEALGKDNGRNA